MYSSVMKRVRLVPSVHTDKNGVVVVVFRHVLLLASSIVHVLLVYSL